MKTEHFLNLPLKLLLSSVLLKSVWEKKTFSTILLVIIKTVLLYSLCSCYGYAFDILFEAMKQ